jgi:DNA mismatch endonuclease, patch repair protein
MRRIRSRNSGPELAVRKLLFSLGYRYRIHLRNLPGSPDIAFSGRRKAIFVHGCFWHSHNGCRRAHAPATNTTYWSSKIKRNIERDRRAVDQLTAMGWKTFIVWECELGEPDKLTYLLRSFLNCD